MKRKWLREKFRENLRRIRNEEGISAETLSRKAGFHRTYAGKLERGEMSPSLDTIDKLAEALDVKPLDLLKDPER